MFEQYKQQLVSKHKLFPFFFCFSCSQFVIEKKFRLFLEAKLHEEEHKQMKKHLKNIEENRELVSIVYVIKQVQVSLVNT